jgi:hypothetical protein
MTALGVRVTGAKGPTFTQRAQVQRCTGTRWASKCARVHTGVTATAAAETATATQRLGRLSRKRNKEPENRRGCARGDACGDTCKNFSQPGSMAGITSGVPSGAVADTMFSLRLEGRGIHR